MIHITRYPHSPSGPAELYISCDGCQRRQNAIHLNGDESFQEILDTQRDMCVVYKIRIVEGHQSKVGGFTEFYSPKTEPQTQPVRMHLCRQCLRQSTR